MNANTSEKVRISSVYPVSLSASDGSERAPNLCENGREFREALVPPNGEGRDASSCTFRRCGAIRGVQRRRGRGHAGLVARRLPGRRGLQEGKGRSRSSGLFLRAQALRVSESRSRKPPLANARALPERRPLR